MKLKLNRLTMSKATNWGKNQHQKWWIIPDFVVTAKAMPKLLLTSPPPLLLPPPQPWQVRGSNGWCKQRGWESNMKNGPYNESNMTSCTTDPNSG